MSIKIDEYISSIGAISDMVIQQNKVETTAELSVTEQEVDTYISTINDSNEAIPCENYNDILQVMQKAKAEMNQFETSSEQSEQMSGTSGSGSAGGSDSEDETTTEVVTINGVTYLETTTVKNGVTSVTRTVIGEQEAETDNSMQEEIDIEME